MRTLQLRIFGEDSFILSAWIVLELMKMSGISRKIVAVAFFSEKCIRGKVVMILQDEFKKNGYTDILIGG